MERYISALAGSALLLAIGIVGSFFALPAFHAAAANDASAVLLWLQVIFLLFSVFLASVYAYSALR